MFGFFNKKKVFVQLESSNQKLKAFISSIDAKRSFQLFSHDLINIKIRSPVNSIQEYNLYLNLVYNMLFNLNKIDLNIFRKLPLLFLLKDWFVDQNGFYLNIEEQIITFKERSIILLDKIIEIESLNSEESQRTLSLLTPVINQIKEITDQLLIVTAKPIDKNILPSAVKPGGIN